MKKLLLLLLTICSISAYAQNDYERTKPVGNSTANMATYNKQTIVDANLKARLTLFVPKGTTPTLNNAKDSVGAVFYNTTDSHFYVYKGSSVWDKYATFDDLANAGITPAVLSDSLSKYMKLQDGLLTGGTPTTNGDSLLVASGTIRLSSDTIAFSPRVFGNIVPSATGLSRVLIVYANGAGLLDSISGTQSSNPVPPNIPINTISIVTVAVNDGGLGVPSAVEAGFAPKNGGDGYIQNQNATAQSATFNINGEGTLNRININDLLFTTGTILSQIPNSDTVNPDSPNNAMNFSQGDVDIRIGTDKSFNIDTYNGGSPINALKIEQDGTITNNGNPIGGGGSAGTVTSVSALTIGTSGTDLNSSVANSTTTPVITLNVPDASASNRGALSSTDWTTFNNKLSTTGSGASLTNVVNSITGTANQVVASASTGPVTLSLPQSIGTASTPQFGSIGIGSAASSSTALLLPASTTTVSSLRIPNGSAPTSPVNGDIWGSGSSLFYRSGSTLQIATTATSLLINSNLNSSQGSGNTNLNGAHVITRAAAANTSESDVGFINQATTPQSTTGSSSGNQIYAPPFVSAAMGYASSGSPQTSQRVEFKHYTVPVQGTTNPTAYYNFSYKNTSTAAAPSSSGYSDVFRIYSDGRIKTTGFTVATLPSTATQGDLAYVTDALAPTYLVTIVGGGSVVTPVFYDGTNWVAH